MSGGGFWLVLVQLSWRNVGSVLRSSSTVCHGGDVSVGGSRAPVRAEGLALKFHALRTIE